MSWEYTTQHTHIFTPTPSLNTWNTHTHTQSVEHQSSGPDGSTMCRQRWELLGYRRHLLHRWWRWWRSERVWVCESVNCATLQRWFTTWMRLWQLCKVTVSFIIKSAVARSTRAVCEPARVSFIRRIASSCPGLTRISSPPIFHSPAPSFTSLHCGALSVNICLWWFWEVRQFPRAWKT